MIETVTFDEATVTKLEGADVIMAIGLGEPYAPKVLVGRERFVSAASNLSKQPGSSRCHRDHSSQRLCASARESLSVRFRPPAQLRRTGSTHRECQQRTV